jgi:hypothetical protein
MGLLTGGKGNGGGSSYTPTVVPPLPEYKPPRPLPPVPEDPTKKFADEQYQETLTKQQQTVSAARKKALEEQDNVPLYSKDEKAALLRANS